MSLIEITNENIGYLTIFLNNEFSSTFRYFNNKTPEEIIKNHYKTILYIDSDIPKGYAHIDYDIINNKYWFGICVASKYCGKGIGTKLINKILDYFNNSHIDSLHLTVDKSNIIAYNMYLKNGFRIERETTNIYIMSLTKTSLLYLPVSFGEAIDKLTILDIKMTKIIDSRRTDVEKEYNVLYTQIKGIINSIYFYYNALKQINLQIWEDQDLFRYSNNDNEKNNICKKIIEDNDARFRIKNKINSILNSHLKEQKGYVPKVFTINYSSNTNYNKLLNSIIKYQLIFNDKVIVVCTPNEVQYINNLFKNDTSIEINSTLKKEPNDEYITMLEQSINNKRFFEFVKSE